MATDTKGRYLELLQATEPPPKLSLFNGLKYLEADGQPLGEETWKALKDLPQSRNLSYLEHGYQRLDKSAAQRLHGYADTICAEVLGVLLASLRDLIRHQPC